MADAAIALAARLSKEDRLGGDMLASAVLALALAGLANDSRTAARKLSCAHALVLRAVAMLSAEPALLRLEARDARTQRQFYTPTGAAEALATD